MKLWVSEIHINIEQKKGRGQFTCRSDTDADKDVDGDDPADFVGHFEKICLKPFAEAFNRSWNALRLIWISIDKECISFA